MPRDRTSRLRAEIAYAMEAPPALLPVLPELLQDLPSLSGATADVLDLLRRAGLPRGAHVLDLGCGRGEIALAVAEAFEACVLGVEAFAPFVAQARRATSMRGSGARCRFVCADLRTALAGHGRYDAALLIALGDILGGPGETVGALRRGVRGGGMMVIDDACLADGVAPPPGYEGYRYRRATEAALIRHGDVILARVERTGAMEAFNASALTAIRRRATDLAEARPELAGDLETYLRRQEQEVTLMAGPVVPAIWALRRRDDG